MYFQSLTSQSVDASANTRGAKASRRKSQRNRRLAAGAAMLVLGAAAIQKTVAMCQGASQAPMPLAYAYVPSPNVDARPPLAAVNCIVLHATVEPTLEGTMGIFLDPRRKVSAHFVVGRDGRVVQMVPVEMRAWHAGTSILDGVNKVNDYSVGIEMVNLNNGSDPYPTAQLDAVAGLIRFIRARYDVPDERIVSHAVIALPPGRKSDPAGFDFDRIKALARIGGAEDRVNIPGNAVPGAMAPSGADKRPSQNQ